MKLKLLINSSIYIIGDVINKAIPFFLLPVLTKHLTPSDYGIITAFGSFVSFITIFIGLSLPGAVNIAFFKLKKKELGIYIVNALIIFAFTVSIVFFIIFIFETEISDRLLLDREWLYIAILVSISQIITILNTILWIAEEKPKAYTIYQLTQTVLITSLTLILIIGFGLSWKGQIISLLIGAVSFAIISLTFLYKRNYFVFKYDKLDMKDLLSFGIPMVPHQLSGWIRTAGDKILLISLVGSASTGLFTVGYQVGMIMGILATAFNKVWSPYLYKQLNNNPSMELKIKIVKFTYIFFFSILLLVAILYYLSKFLFIYIIDEKFIASQEFVLYVLLSNALNGMYFMVVGYLFYLKKTSFLAYITFSIALVHVLLNYFLINIYGTIGVAYGGVITMGMIFVIVWYVSNRVYPMPWLFWKFYKKVE